MPDATTTGSASTPVPTRDLDAALTDLRLFGACIVEDALDERLLADVHEALYRAADTDRRYGLEQDYAYGSDAALNQRIWNLPSHDPVFCALAEHPVAVKFVREVIGWPALLSSMSANIVSGGGQMVLHPDQGYMPRPWTKPHGVNVAWCVDDFTQENGATCFIPGSHLWDVEQRNEGDRVRYSLGMDEVREQLVPIEAPAGAAVVMEGRVLHTNGVNTSGQRRAGIFGWYTLPIYLPQENWYLSLNPSVRQFGSDTLLTLLGFRPQVLGRVNGRAGI